MIAINNNLIPLPGLLNRKEVAACLRITPQAVSKNAQLQAKAIRHSKKLVRWRAEDIVPPMAA